MLGVYGTMHGKFFKNILISTCCVLAVSTSGAFAMDGGPEEEITLTLLPRNKKVKTNPEPANNAPIMGSKAHDRKTQEFVLENREAIEAFYQAWQKEGADTRLIHHDLLVPHAQFLFDTMKKGPQNPHIQKLIKETEGALKDKEISGSWMLDMHIRYAALLGDPSESEKDLFRYTSTPGRYAYFERFWKKDIKGNPLVTRPYQMRESLDNVYGEDSFSTKLPLEVCSQIDAEIEKRLPRIMYPCLGDSVFHPKFLLNCWMKGIHPIGIPLTDLHNIHGNPASPLGFTLHEIIHAQQDKRIRALTKYIYDEVERALKVGRWASDVVLPIIDLAVEKYTLFMEGLDYAYQQLSNDKEAVTGLFYLTHEYPSIKASVFKTDSLSGILTEMALGSNKAINKDGSWDNPKDPLVTLPTTGESFLADEEIKDVVLEKAAFDPEIAKVPEAHKTPEGMQGWKDLMSRESRISLKKTADFIVATLELRDGRKQEYVFPTLHRKWKNFATHEGMLKYAGHPIRQPDLEGRDTHTSREFSLRFVGGVKSAIITYMLGFVVKAQKIFGEGPDSYTEGYKKKFNEIEEKLNQIISPKK
jgi:hypothetical protein